MRRAIAILASALIGGAAVAAVPGVVPDPVFAPAMRALFDRPLATGRRIVAPLDPGGPRGVVRCFRYPAAVVKEVDYGEHGDDHISIIPLARGAPGSACALEKAKGEVVLASSEASYFLGAKGPFGLVQSTESDDDEPLAVHDLATGRMLYSDGLAVGTRPGRVSISGNALVIDYVRGAGGSCSILKGAVCWTAFAAEARLPPEIAYGPPPTALCKAGYTAARAGASVPSVLRYGVALTLARTGEPDIRPGRLIGCGPRS